MDYSVRPLQPEVDAGTVAQLWRFVEEDPPTAEELIRDWARVPEGGRRHRLVANDEAGALLGYAAAGFDPWAEPGRWFVRVVVFPERRHRGLGTDLLERVSALARRDGAAVIGAEVRECDEASCAWARSRGFAVDRHLFESVLDVAAFDEAPFAGVVAGAEAGGIRFFSRREDPSEATARKVCDLVERAVLDIPGIHPGPAATFEQWAVWALDEQRVPPDCFLMAFDGERAAGVTMLERRATGGMYTSHTSVAREYRGRHVALALKLLSVRVARRYGAPHMRTHNDSQNGPMLAVNRKLGYRPEPGVYLMEKRL